MSKVYAILLGLVFALVCAPSRAAISVWSGAADNKWNTTSANWTRGGTPGQAYVDGDTVVFDDSSSVTNINIEITVNPGSVLITNATKTYTFTNAIIGGAGSLVKSGSGAAYFGSQLAGSSFYTNSLLFSGGTTISNGVLGYVIGTNASGSYATGGSPIGFGTGSIRLDGVLATLQLTAGTNLSAAVVLTNDLVIGPNGGIATLTKGTGSSPQINLSGNISLYGNFSITNCGNLGTGQGGNTGAVWRVLTPGITRVYNSCTVTVEGASASLGVRGIWAQNIQEVGGSQQLTLAGGIQVNMVDFIGDNTGLTGGIVVQKNGGVETGPLVFTSTNAMGGGGFTVRSNAYAGLAFNFSAAVVSGMSYENDAVLGIDSNSSANIDFSAIGKDVWLGSVRGATYSGTLTPFGTTYKLGGGFNTNWPPLILANTNALTGARMLLVGGPTNSLLMPGNVVLAAPNNYSGGTEITGNIRSRGGSVGNALLTVRSADALGSGPITLRQWQIGAPSLFFDAPVPVILTNSIILTGSVSSVALFTTNKLILRGPLTVYGTNSLSISPSSLGQPIVVFDQASAGQPVTFATGGRISQDNGIFDPGSVANFPTNIGYRQNSGGTLVLSPGFMWGDFVTNRAGVNNSEPPAGQYQALGYAARGATQIIDDSGSYQASLTGSPWLTGPNLGSEIRDTDGSFYANAPLKITRTITTSNKEYTVSMASMGPGYTNSSSFGVCHEYAGRITGIGVLCFANRSGVTVNFGQMPELVLSGTNNWTGGYNGNFSTGHYYATGPGGIAIIGSTGPYGFIRFDGNSSLPTGNGGRLAYLMAMNRTTSKGNMGYLLTGGVTERVYSLPAGYVFLLGGQDNTSAMLGAAAGRATLTNSTVQIFLGNTWGAANSTNQYLQLAVRDATSVFTLGSVEGAVKLVNVYGTGNADKTGWWDTSSNATPMVDRNLGSNTRIDKYGAGMLVLSNVVYTMMDGTSDVATNFTWQIGSDRSMRFFEGVVKETGSGTNNSLRNHKFVMKGGIYGVVSDWTPTVGTNAAQLSCESTRDTAWGFSAYNGNRTINARPATGTLLRWGQTVSSASYFLYDGVILTLNAPDAEGELTFGASDVDIDLSNTSANPREFTVWSTNYAARIACAIKNTQTGVGAGQLVKNGPGRLILSALTNTYNGLTSISNGTLTVNGLLTASTNGITVYTGAALEGTGTLNRAVSVANGATLAAGAGAGLTGTLTISSNLVLTSGATLAVDFTSSGNDQVVVRGTGAIDLTGCSLSVIVPAGDTPPGGNVTILWAPNATISGTFTSITRGYKVSISDDGHYLYLRKNSPGFIFRAQ